MYYQSNEATILAMAECVQALLKPYISQRRDLREIRVMYFILADNPRGIKSREAFYDHIKIFGLDERVKEVALLMLQFNDGKYKPRVNATSLRRSGKYKMLKFHVPESQAFLLLMGRLRKQLISYGSTSITSTTGNVYSPAHGGVMYIKKADSLSSLLHKFQDTDKHDVGVAQAKVFKKLLMNSANTWSLKVADVDVLIKRFDLYYTGRVSYIDFLKCLSNGVSSSSGYKYNVRSAVDTQLVARVQSALQSSASMSWKGILYYRNSSGLS